MKLAILLLVTIVAAARSADKDDVVITEHYFPDSCVIYTGKHEIVDIVVPFNEINYPEIFTERIDEARATIFFVEADIKDNGEKDYKGLYVYKDRQAKKVLDNGQCATYGKNTNAYFGAKDGIYKYNDKDMTATKYGTVTDSVIRMAVNIQNKHVYYLTEDYVLYKFNEDDTATAKIDAVKDARDIAFDYDGYLFYYDGNKQFYTYNGENVLKVEGLPANPTSVDLVRAPLLLNEPVAVLDGRIYEIRRNGTSVESPIKFQSKPTAYAPDDILFQYYAYKQKIYYFNLVEIINNKTIEEVSSYFAEHEDQKQNPLKGKKAYRLM